MRAYDKIPFILEPAEFGMALAKWWLSVQPSFRNSDGPFPKQVYSDAAPSTGDSWAPLRKSGPNGFVSVVTMMRWWGHHVLNPSNEFKVDSTAEWRYMVYDIKMCIHEVRKSIPVAGAKRKRERGDVAGKENKR